MRRLATRIEGLVLLEPSIVGDPRGFFVETYRVDVWRSVGVDADFVQDNHSRSVRDTIRGLHYQAGRGQPKLVRCARGSIVDVALDIRPGSATFGQFEIFELDDERHRQLFVPAGFAHGFCATSDVADVTYKVGTYYEPTSERGIAWDDPELAIPWPTSRPIVSARDQRNPTFREVRDSLGT
jgi:dTDP-4-dehydrorhamnose 3,5-epimerase